MFFRNHFLKPCAINPLVSVWNRSVRSNKFFSQVRAAIPSIRALIMTKQCVRSTEDWNIFLSQMNGWLHKEYSSAACSGLLLEVQCRMTQEMWNSWHERSATIVIHVGVWWRMQGHARAYQSATEYNDDILLEITAYFTTRWCHFWSCDVRISDN